MQVDRVQDNVIRGAVHSSVTISGMRPKVCNPFSVLLI